MSWRTDIADQLASHSATASGYVRVHCPACPSRVGKDDHSRACSVSTQTGWWLCHRCGYRGRLDGYDEPDQLEELVPDPELEQPSDYVEVTPDRASVLPAAVAWLESRRVDPRRWLDARIGYARTGLHAGRLILPLVSSPDWRAVGWVGRLVRTPRSWEHPYHTAAGVARASFYNGDALTARDPRPLLVTEGPMDALRVFPHAVACLGKPTADQLARLASCARPLVLTLDADAWQDGLTRAMQLRVAGRRAWCLALPHGRDPDTCPPRLLLEAAKYAVEHQTDVDLRE